MASMDFARIREQGVEFAVVVVQPYALHSPDKEQIRSSYSGFFPDMPIILMAQDARGIPTYDGRRDIVQFLANVNPAAIPWQRMTY